MPSCEISGFHSGFAEYSGLLRLYAEPTGKLTSLHIPEDLSVHNAIMLSGICEACLLRQVQDWFLFLLSVPAPRAGSCCGVRVYLTSAFASFQLAPARV